MYKRTLKSHDHQSWLIALELLTKLSVLRVFVLRAIIKYLTLVALAINSICQVYVIYM